MLVVNQISIHYLLKTDYENKYEVCFFGLQWLDITQVNVMALSPKIKP